MIANQAQNLSIFLEASSQRPHLLLLLLDALKSERCTPSIEFCETWDFGQLSPEQRTPYPLTSLPRQGAPEGLRLQNDLHGTTLRRSYWVNRRGRAGRRDEERSALARTDKREGKGRNPGGSSCHTGRGFLEGWVVSAMYSGGE